MKDVSGDLWTYLEAAGFGGARVITTNGFVKRDGTCVMGRGCAREAAERWPWLPGSLGGLLREHGNQCFRFPMEWGSLVTMPVKPVVGPLGEPGWSCPANLVLITRSAHELVALADEFEWPWVVLPRPGCGYGHLDYADVRPVIEPILDDRFRVITWTA